MVQIGDAAPQWEWTQLTEEEKDVWKILCGKRDYESVKQYLEGISPDLRARYVADQNETYYDEAEKAPVWGWLAATGAGVIQWPGMLYSGGVAISNAVTGEERPVDPNSPFLGRLG